ncbi:hypothetical protein [Plastoroseomonas arctica]|uniref:Uncharacterized protein n=1 Tax=Plastoroseomonas arctica TaxID=1509237 RepID=A0AAF1JYW2_9PROT|nr:hypothetical protein [Plastoroseomonas arctica]MBR0656275.1 hypothetical protein [Plastoroseomonas arctica]
MLIPGIELTDVLAWGVIAAGTAFHMLRSLGPQASMVGAALAAFGAKALLLNIA